MIPQHIVVQAGGKGTRMDRLTRNKPKALIPVNNLPMIFHLFKKYPGAKYTIIGDYKYEVLDKYLATFADVDYRIVNASGKQGTCAGLKKAFEQIQESTPFLLIWCDLVLPDDFEIPDGKNNLVGISNDFRCRWSWRDGKFEETPSDEYGVAGLFVFQNKLELSCVPEEGEFVRWLQESSISFSALPLHRTKEYGLISEYERLPQQRCRPFNRISFEGEVFIKEGIDEQGRSLASHEVAWYKKLRDFHFENIPVIYDYEPLKMERIQGKNVFEYSLTYCQKNIVLRGIVNCLKSIQAIESVASDKASYYEAYIGKTFLRLEKINELVPFAKDREIIINGKPCRNVFYHREEVQRLIERYFPKEFRLIHGDCTFCNIMLRDKDLSPVLIDPRGYFGNTEFFGDPAYDWAKLYYSLVGNYDQFNLKRFSLEIRTNDVLLNIASNGWEEVETEFFRLLADEVTEEQIKLIHAIIWLSLTTYAWEDYDSICGAFYNGTYYLEELL